MLLFEEVQAALLLRRTGGGTNRGRLAYGGSLTNRCRFADRLSLAARSLHRLAMLHLPTLTKTPDTSCQGQDENDGTRHNNTP